MFKVHVDRTVAHAQYLGDVSIRFPLGQPGQDFGFAGSEWHIGLACCGASLRWGYMQYQHRLGNATLAHMSCHKTAVVGHSRVNLGAFMGALQPGLCLLATLRTEGGFQPAHSLRRAPCYASMTIEHHRTQ